MSIRLEIDRRAGHLPQFRGAVIAAVLGEKEEIVQAGIDAANMISGEPPIEGNKGKKGKPKPTLQQRAEEVARRMLEAGYTPQEIGEVTARILEGNQPASSRK